MSLPPTYVRDPDRDLLLERSVDVPPELVWAAWTTPEHLVKWFAPAPMTTTDCEVDLRPGGIFKTTMRSPDGQEYPGVGCYLEIVPNQRLVWSSVLGPGFRPQDDPDGFPFTGILSLEPDGSGTRYSAVAVHGDPTHAQRHADMGFHEGWSTCLDQLVAAIHDGRIGVTMTKGSS